MEKKVAELEEKIAELEERINGILRMQETDTQRQIRANRRMIGLQIILLLEWAAYFVIALTKG